MNYKVVTVTKKTFKEIRNGALKSLFIYDNSFQDNVDCVIFRCLTKKGTGYKTLLPLALKKTKNLNTPTSRNVGCLINW